MTAEGYQSIIDADDEDRRGLFEASAQRLGTPAPYVEKDFWVCWTLNELYNGLDGERPRLLFKGGTSLSKAFGLINRFSEDIDITVFRDDIGKTITPEALAALSGKKQRAELEAIRDACGAYIQGPLLLALRTRLAAALSQRDQSGRIEVDGADPDGQTLLLSYPSVTARDGGYIQPVVRIESGAKSALDPNHPQTITPYVAADTELDLRVPGVLTVDPRRTFWDKVVIVHGLRRWFDNKGELRNEGNRVTRHYYDLHCMLQADVGQQALADEGLARDCVQHAILFFNRPANDLASAAPGTYAIVPAPEMLEGLRRDYAQMSGMIFGDVPAFDAVLASLEKLDGLANRR